MSGRTTAKQRWQPNKEFRAGVPYKYTRTVNGHSKNYILVAKYTDATPQLWPTWFENVYPNSWWLTNNRIADFQVWPGDTVVNMNTGYRYTNNQQEVMFVPEVAYSQQSVKNSLIESKVIRGNPNCIERLEIYPFYNPHYEETAYYIELNRDQSASHALYLYEVDGTQIYHIGMMNTYPLLTAGSVANHTLTISYRSYTDITHTGIAPNSSSGTQCSYLLPNSIAEYVLTITESAGAVTINFANA